MLRIIKLSGTKWFSEIIKPQRTLIKFRTVKPNLTNALKLLVGTNICCSLTFKDNPKKMATEEDVHRVLEEGDVAIIKLMDQIKELIQIISEEYRNAIDKQIEITKTASNTGPLSEMWDELPKHRTLADKLLKEINEYIALFNTMGQLAKDKSLVEFVVTNRDYLDVITVKYQEIEKIIQHELELNKELETKLLRAHCDSILNEMSK